jgi:hypothetical protein
MPPSYILKKVDELAGGSNWNIWKVDMRMYFMGEEAWTIINGTDKKPTPTSTPDNSEDVKKWEKIATTFLSTIYFACTRDVRAKIQQCETAPEAWKLLQEEFEKDIPSTRLALHTEFQSVLHDTSKPVSIYTNRILELADQLGALNRRPPDEVVSDTMLAHLDPTFSEIMTTLSSVDKIATPKDIAARLDAWERTRKVAAISREKAAASTANDGLSIGGSALAARGNELNNWGNRSKDSKACNRCGLRGHFAHECDVQMPAHIREKVTARRAGRRQRSHSARHVAESDSGSSSGSDTSRSCSHSCSRSPSPSRHRNPSSSKSSSSSSRRKVHHAVVRTHLL